MGELLDAWQIKMMKNKFIYLIPVLSFVFVKTTAQNTYANTITNKTPTQIQSSTNIFKNINFSDPQLYSSGLIFSIIERQFLIIQKSGLDEVSKFKELAASVDIILDSIKKNEKLYNDLTKYLFQYFEKYSLFTASEYIALKAALNEKSLSLCDRLCSLLRSQFGRICS